MIVTIDGPSASGKSSAARHLAHMLGAYYICTGYLYRTVAYLLIHEHGFTLDTLPSIRPHTIEQLPWDELKYTYTLEKGGQVWYQGQDITGQLKNAQIDVAAAIISQHKTVREYIGRWQQQLADQNSVVIEGRDTGTVVFPHAQFKFFLTADLPIRAARWVMAEQQRGKTYEINQAIALLQERDKWDQQREIGPLLVASDAIIIDNSALTMEQTVEQMLACIKNK